MIVLLGKNLILMGIVLIVIGVLFTLGSRLGIGRLPGDIFIKKGNMTFYFPVVTSIVISIVLTLILNLFRK
ncbi:hypothetical protein EAL2_c09630 [Peptoclostridium acidaminophilum DSM 3953]|uniref:DUF2905 domain-containing protein n=1 Tax=Peptoclostridium acidaminophilum DSM 3953 TaxID=1286171 RepID=W8TJ84_PEPAC|nr:DUF2905 domain-containing protein [Peptoclostridium acidaminophilum]AHM56262.1 hypothetical protein EAL2_c09630 [Peptoclostridium acidaminophilum DSM 3953]